MTLYWGEDGEFGRNDKQMRDGVISYIDHGREGQKEFDGMGTLQSQNIRDIFYSKYFKMTIISCYSPTNEAEEEDKDQFYDQLQDTVSKISGHDYGISIFWET